MPVWITLSRKWNAANGILEDKLIYIRQKVRGMTNVDDWIFNELDTPEERIRWSVEARVEATRSRRSILGPFIWTINTKLPVFKPAADIKGRLLSRREKQLFSNRNQISPIDLVLGFVTSRRCNFFPASKSVGACYIFTFNKLQFNSSRKCVTFACKERYHAVKAERKLKCLEKQVDMPLHK